MNKDKDDIYKKVKSILSDNPDTDLNDAVQEAETSNKKKKKPKKPKLIEKKMTCSNFWCKGLFDVKYYVGESFSKICPTCTSFDTELSGGVESAEKQYDGPRHDGLAHEVEFHFSEYKHGKGFWNK